MERTAGIQIFILILVLGVLNLVFSQQSSMIFTVLAADSQMSQPDPEVIQDNFFAPDKAKHLMASMISTVFLYKLTETHTSLGVADSKYFSVGVTLGLGLGKELIDNREKKNHFCWKDLIADLAGIGVGLVIINQP